jgi:hypothetical protein
LQRLGLGSIDVFAARWIARHHAPPPAAIARASACETRPHEAAYSAEVRKLASRG